MNILFVMFIPIMYGEFESKNITQCVDYDKVVFVDVTVDWCVTYKFNNITALYSIRALGLIQRKCYCNIR